MNIGHPDRVPGALLKKHGLERAAARRADHSHRRDGGIDITLPDGTVIDIPAPGKKAKAPKKR